MNDLTKRILLFLLLCIPTRLYFVYLAKTSNKETLRILGYISIIPALGFLYIYMTNSRRTGSETFGKPIWWNNLRPLHSFLYFLFSYMAIRNNKESYKVLFFDVLIGLISFLKFHYFT